MFIEKIYYDSLLNAYQWLWLNFGQGALYISFFFNNLNTVMLCVVLVITLSVLYYSREYMALDPRRRLFLGHIFIFSAFMLVFVASDDLITAFIGWEGVGLSSFFLINFWWTRIQANKAAFKAILVNKIGDSFFLFAIVLSFYHWKTVSFDLLFQAGLCNLVNDEILFSIGSSSIVITDVVCFSLVIAAMAKSAQLGLHTWLPDAMEGPTPVSALIHAATMVTAGILLLIKCYPLFVDHLTLLNFIAFVGACTSVLAGTIACAQHDLKKIIAYSTCSQLGLMFMACGLGQPIFAFFHLVTHAFFKALLFLTAGVVVHFLNGEQDIRRMGGLSFSMPFANLSFFFGNLCITGFPFYSGFYSKELIVLGSSDFAFSLYCLSIVSTCLTILYSCRLQWFVMWNPGPPSLFLEPRLFVTTKFFTLQSFFDFFSLLLSSKRSLEMGFRIRRVLIILLFLSITTGFYFSDFMVSRSLLQSSFESTAMTAFYFERSEAFLKLVPILCLYFVTMGFFEVQDRELELYPFYMETMGFFRGNRLAYDKAPSKLPYALYLKYELPELSFFYRYIYEAFVQAWFFNSFINFMCERMLKFGYFVYKYLDRGLVDFLFGFSNIWFFSSLLLKMKSFTGLTTLTFYYLLIFFSFFLFASLSMFSVVG